MSFEQFSTERLAVQDWTRELANSTSRRGLEKALRPILADRVLEHLPPPLHLSATEDGVSGWVNARADESDVFVVRKNDNGAVIGLLILAKMDVTEKVTGVHFGYLFAEEYWGHGYATELIRGFIGEMESQGPALLIGGVDKTNTASASVLRKAGFKCDPGMSTPDTEIFVYPAN